MAINLSKQDNPTLWYYTVNGQQFGPLGQEELLKVIGPDTMVWRDGISWTSAELLPELAPHIVKGKSHIPLGTQPMKEVGNTQLSSASSMEKQKMFASPFSFNGRIRRSEYGISLLIFYFLAFVLGIIGERRGDVSPLAWVAIIPLYWFLFAQGAKRCHDRNASGWYQIIPFYVLWMLFAEGDPQENSYGGSPK
jgi:uncharacterized membrane protein YhaH (DUF805 family)